jgi:hypothetical protein
MFLPPLRLQPRLFRARATPPPNTNMKCFSSFRSMLRKRHAAARHLALAVRFITRTIARYQIVGI